MVDMLSMLDVLLVGLTVAWFWSAFVLIAWEIGNGYSEISNGFITPRWFYEIWELNWFGSWFMFILLSILSPLCTIVKLLYVIWYGISNGIKWLFTVGR